MFKKQTITFTVLAFFLLNLYSCGLNETEEEFDRMEQLALNACDCDMVELQNYIGGFFSTTAELEIVGANNKSQEEVALRINQIWKDSIQDYCNIDEISLVFITTGKNKTIIIKNCEVIPQARGH